MREEGEASDDEGGNAHSQNKRSRRRDDEVVSKFLPNCGVIFTANHSLYFVES